MFISSFRSMIDSMRCSEAIKLTYLRELLTDEVRKSIAGKLCRPALYRSALQELHRKYGHPHLIARAYTDTLLAIEPMRKNDTASLRKFAGEVHETISTLIEYKLTSELESGGILSQLVGKLPERYQDKWGKRVWTSQPEILNLTHFDAFLEELVMSKKVVRPNEHLECPPSGNRRSRLSHAVQPRVHAIQHEAEGPTCEACTEPGHQLKECRVFAAWDLGKRLLVAKERRLCFSCLEKNHRSRECRRKAKCGVDGCEMKHHRLLHGPMKKVPATIARAPRSDEPSVNAAQQATTTIISMLPVVPVCIRSGNRTLHTHALLDPGSDRSLIRSDAARKLRLDGPSIKIRPRTFHGQDPPIRSKAVDYNIASIDGSFTARMERVLVVPRLTGADRRFNLKEIAGQYDYLKDLPLPSDVPEAITLLLGTDATIYAHEQLAIVKPAKGEKTPAAVLTPFGWTLFGPVLRQGGGSSSTSTMMISTYEVLEEPNDLVKTLWDTDCLGIVSPAPQSAEDRRAARLLEETTRKVGNRYEAALLWKRDKPDLPNNYGQALHRFLTLERRLIRDPRLAERYQRTIDDHVKDGFAVLVEEQDKGEVGKIWYLPHHAVVNPNKPDKIRVVFDASARHLGTSLNDGLLKGPDLSANLIDIILKFRLQRVAIASDVEGMYHQVRVRESDQSALRFLWRPPGSTEEPRKYQMRVHVFGAVSSPTTCIHAMQRTAEDHRKEHIEVAEKVFTNVYVDNFLDSCETEEEAAKIASEMTTLLAKGGFRLTKWISTSRAVMEKIPNSEWLDPSFDLERDPLPNERILGLQWSSEEDVFTFRLDTTRNATLKREILSEVAKVYDPLGFLTPIVLFAKVLLQSLWRHGTEWNEKPPEALLTAWENWRQSLSLLDDLKIPRCIYTSPQVTPAQLHIFTDASEQGYGAVAYLRPQVGNGWETKFVASKSRVAPIKHLTIPRLELSGAVVGVRLARTICRSLGVKIHHATFWTDSQTVLQWIYSRKRRFQAFVGNRVGEILEATRAQQWRHVPGKHNTADQCSRGATADAWDRKDWFRGPAFLSEAEKEWPPRKVVAEPEDDSELVTESWIGALGVVENECAVDLLLRRKSTLVAALRIIALVLRFINALKAARNAATNEEPKLRNRPQSAETRRLPSLTAADLNTALASCVRLSQQAAFTQEFRQLERAEPIPASSRLAKLNPYLDENAILHSRGRLENAALDPGVRNPVILPPDSEISRLIIASAHEKLHHASSERTFHELRQKYWVLKGRQAVRRYVANCPRCRRESTQPNIPLMAPLPRHRLQAYAPPFTNTGVDYFGPWNVTVFRRSVKRYGCLFTCLVTRAVHIEVAYSLDTDSFLMAFQRFCDRRGTPKVVYSDNGTNLVAGERELNEAVKSWNEVKIAAAMAHDFVEWHFSPPAAPHFGGVWERLVRSAKVALKRI